MERQNILLRSEPTQLGSTSTQESPWQRYEMANSLCHRLFDTNSFIRGPTKNGSSIETSLCRVTRPETHVSAMTLAVLPS
jgi:hypothetical protein